MTTHTNTWKVTTRYLMTPSDDQECVFWYPTEEAAQIAVNGFRMGGRIAWVERDTSNIR